MPTAFFIILASLLIFNIAFTAWLVLRRKQTPSQTQHSDMQFSQLAQQLTNFTVLTQSHNQSNAEKLEQLSKETHLNILNTRDHISQQLHKDQLNIMQHLQDNLYKNMHDVRQQLSGHLNQQQENISQSINKLTQDTHQQLQTISGVVEKRLSEGFEKTTATFTDVIKRLALIDEAQKKITELSKNVVSLQTILADKRSRGAFGEVQLSALINNTIPAQHVSWQHTLSNNKRADCLLFLPEPTGNIVIDSKFPLESYQRLCHHDLTKDERRSIEQQFRKDIRKHIQDIADKYIIAGETADGAMMFIPAEAIFAEIHSHYPELVEIAHKARVWLTSPTTMMAILTTARAVLKDAATRKQIHIIQEHLSLLAKDFQRFQSRMDNLSRHIKQAHEDVSAVNTSAQKITSRFSKIEKVELEEAQS
ncbi:MAG: DNA recombination protein RmuC [Gammaproteobacteria bacterium]